MNIEFDYWPGGRRVTVVISGLDTKIELELNKPEFETLIENAMQLLSDYPNDWECKVTREDQ